MDNSLVSCLNVTNASHGQRQQKNCNFLLIVIPNRMLSRVVEMAPCTRLGFSEAVKVNSNNVGLFVCLFVCLFLGFFLLLLGRGNCVFLGCGVWRC